MLTSEAVTNVKTSTSHDSDDQVSTAQYVAWFQVEQDRIRRRLAAAVPTYAATTASFTLTGSTVTMAQPATFLALVRLEKLSGSRYYAVPVSNGLDTSGSGALEYRELGANIVVEPVEEAPGTYLLTYVTKGATLAADMSTALDLPIGFEDVACERVAARVRERCSEDPAPHIRRAEEVWREVFPAFKRRYGAHPVSGLRRVRG